MNKISFAIILLLLLLFLFILQSNFTLEGYENHKMYTYVHIPKTGGSSIIKYLKKYSEHFDLKSNHFHDIIATKQNNPVLCIREPMERFYSMYKYWKQHIHDQYPEIDDSVKNFINLVNKKSNYLVLGPSNQPFIHKQHYMPQSTYLKSDVYRYAIVIKYDKENMGDKMNKLLDYLHIKNKNIKLLRENVSKYDDIELLDEEDREFIMNTYYTDFELWNHIQKNPHLFLKVI